VAGTFGNAPGYVARTSVARLNQDGTTDKTFKPLVVKADGAVADLGMVEVLGNGQILIGGDFASVNAVPRTGMARLNPDGSLDATFNAQIDIPGGSNIIVADGGEMNGRYPVLGSVFYNGADCGFFTRLTGTGALDPTFGPSGGQIPAPHVNLFNGWVRCGTHLADGRLVVGGDFTEIIDNSGAPPLVRRLACFTADGLVDHTFIANPGADDSIYAVHHQRKTSSQFLIGGAFTAYNGLVRNRLARVNPNGGADVGFDPGAGTNGSVRDIRNYDRNKTFIVGSFTTYNNISRRGIARIIRAGASNPGLLLLLD
jgi:hypothetical protein